MGANQKHGGDEKMTKKIAVLGSGSMGIAISMLLLRNGHEVVIWSPFKEEIEMIKEERAYEERLPKVVIPNTLKYSCDLEQAINGADIVVLAIPSQTVRKNIKDISKFIDKSQIIVSCSKGIEKGTRKIMTDVIKEELPQIKTTALSGPSFAIEIALGLPTVVVAASEDKKVAQAIQNTFMSPSFRVYTNIDVKGVELGGALKNVIALCAGISDGLGYGNNSKAALITRGITEISRLGVALGAKQNTFWGLTGIGDLLLTCTGEHSRNKKAGYLIGKGKKLQDVLDEVKMVVEGVETTKPAYEISKEKNISMPIVNEAYNVLFENKNPKKAVTDLMMRNRKCEMEGIK